MTGKDGKRNYSEIRLLNYGSVLTIALFPNPAKNLTYLYSSATEKVTVQILDNMGREVSKQVKTVGTAMPATLDISKLHSGPYFVKITSSAGSTTERLLIQ